jgi:hypothetical protein
LTVAPEHYNNGMGDLSDGLQGHPRVAGGRGQDHQDPRSDRHPGVSTIKIFSTDLLGE